MTPEEHEKKLKNFREWAKDKDNVYEITEPKTTEDGFINPAFLNQLESILRDIEERE